MLETKMLSELLVEAKDEFSKANLDTPHLDAKLLLQHATGYSSAEIISNSTQMLSSAQINHYLELRQRRLKREPVHRITGEREFYGRAFKLSDETLIPRPDTEILVEAVISETPLSILEIGTGSGAIAVSLAAELENVSILATDVSQDALSTANQNAKAHGVNEKIQFVKADLFEGLKGTFDAIISNPPYIPSAELVDLQDEVRFFDPSRALDGGIDGLDFYRSILAKAPKYLRDGGQIFLELGIDQGEDVRQIAEGVGFKNIKLINDLNNIERVFSAQLFDFNT